MVRPGPPLMWSFWLILALQVPALLIYMLTILWRLGISAGEVWMEPALETGIFLIVSVVGLFLWLAVLYGLVRIKRRSRGWALILYSLLSLGTFYGLVQHTDWLGRIAIFYVDSPEARFLLRQRWITLFDSQVAAQVHFDFLFSDIWLLGLLINQAILIGTLLFLLRPLIRDYFLYYDPPRKAYDQSASAEELRAAYRFVWEKKSRS